MADHLQQEKNEGQSLTGPLQMRQKVYQCPTSQAIGLIATRLLSLPRQDNYAYRGKITRLIATSP